MAASSSRGLEFCEDKQIWLIKKNYEDNKCNRGGWDNGRGCMHMVIASSLRPFALTNLHLPLLC